MNISYNKNMQKKIEFRRGALTIRGHIYGSTEACSHAVILCHGFLANERMCRKYAQLLADMGFLAVTFDFCGGGLFSRSDGRTQDMTVFSEIEDLQAVVETIRTQFTPKSITVMGCSQGGFVAGLYAAAHPEIDRLILFYPAICIPDDARGGKMMFYRFDPAHIPAVLGRFPMKLGGDYARTVLHMDPYEEMKGYDGPVLLVHGTEDTIVDISYSRALKDIYPHCHYEEIPGGGHMFRGQADEKACQILQDFMRSAL